MNKYTNINVINKSKVMLSDLYKLKEGDYKLKDGVILTSNGSVVNKKYYFDGNGAINIDEYGNVKFKINYKDKCIIKTFVGNIVFENNKCSEFNDFEVNIIRNNSVISFTSERKNLSYKLSYEDDFKGKWIKVESDNLVLKYYREGKNYIWFKDEAGNLSDKIIFEVDCLDTKKAEYNQSVFYCSGSTVTIDNIEWVVIEDNSDFIKLLKYLPLEDKLSPCFEEESEFCFYNNTNNNTHTWKNSYINYYLNNIYINKLSSSLVNKLRDNEICNEYYNYSCNNDICGGYTKEEIEHNNYVCNEYVKSKIKIISYDEYNYVYGRSKDKKVINGNYWAINSYEINKGSSILYDYDFYILESLTNKLDIKPVIIIDKYSS